MTKMTDAFKQLFLGLGGDAKELAENNDVGDYIKDLEEAIKGYVTEQASPELPSVTTDDNGKILAVIDGVWDKHSSIIFENINIPDGAISINEWLPDPPSTSTGKRGDICVQYQKDTDVSGEKILNIRIWAIYLKTNDSNYPLWTSIFCNNFHVDNSHRKDRYILEVQPEQNKYGPGHIVKAPLYKTKTDYLFSGTVSSPIIQRRRDGSGASSIETITLNAFMSDVNSIWHDILHRGVNGVEDNFNFQATMFTNDYSHGFQNIYMHCVSVAYDGPGMANIILAFEGYGLDLITQYTEMYKIDVIIYADNTDNRNMKMKYTLTPIT